MATFPVVVAVHYTSFMGCCEILLLPQLNFDYDSACGSNSHG